MLPFLYLLVLCVAKTILLTNDDSFVSTNIRATYRDLKDAGYTVILVAPASQRSGYAGKFDVPDGNKLTADGEFLHVKAGDPAWGRDDDDEDIWYFDGTPSSCVAFALDYVIPNYYDDVDIDLTIGGPNEGPNLSPGFYTASGTMSAVYYSLYRGIPAISFSGSNLNNSYYKDGLDDDDQNPANIYAKKVVTLTKLILKSKTSIPNTVGLNVNFPLVGNEASDCDDPVFQLSRLLGPGVFMPSLKYDDLSDSFSWTYDFASGVAEDYCVVGDCNLPSEYAVFWALKCISSVTVFTINNDANTDQISTVKNIIGNVLKNTGEDFDEYSAPSLDLSDVL